MDRSEKRWARVTSPYGHTTIRERVGDRLRNSASWSNIADLKSEGWVVEDVIVLTQQEYERSEKALDIR